MVVKIFLWEPWDRELFLGLLHGMKCVKIVVTRVNQLYLIQKKGHRGRFLLFCGYRDPSFDGLLWFSGSGPGDFAGDRNGLPRLNSAHEFCLVEFLQRQSGAAELFADDNPEQDLQHGGQDRVAGKVAVKADKVSGRTKSLKTAIRFAGNQFFSSRVL